MKKRLMMILSVMLLALTCVFAAQEMTVTWEWRIDDDPEVNYYRFQLDATEDGRWTIVGGDTKEVTIKELDPYKSYTLYLQRSYDGVNWSETASAEASALLVDEVEEAAAEAPAAEAAPVEAPAEVPAEVPAEDAASEEIIGGADGATDIVIEDTPAEPAEEPAEVPAEPVEEPAPEPMVNVGDLVADKAAEKPSRFGFTLTFRPGANLALDYSKKGVLSGAQSSLSPFAIGLDFQNVISNDKVGLGIRANISADAYAVNGWGSFFGSPKWNPIKWEWGKMFDFKDSYAWAITGSALAELNARAGIADFNLGAGFGASALLDIGGRDMGAKFTKFRFQNLFKTPVDLALFADFQFGTRFYLGNVVTLGLETNYKLYIPNFKQGDVSVNAVLGFTF